MLDGISLSLSFSRICCSQFNYLLFRWNKKLRCYGGRKSKRGERKRKEKERGGGGQSGNIERTGDEAKVYDDTYDEVRRKLSSFGMIIP